MVRYFPLFVLLLGLTDTAIAAVDTAAKRASVLNLSGTPLLPVPSSGVSLADRAHLSLAYSGFAYGAPETVPVPNVVGLSASAADTALEADGLDTGSVASVCSGQSLGLVVGQSPPAGIAVSLGTLVDLAVSSGAACKGAGGKFRLHLDLRL